MDCLGCSIWLCACGIPIVLLGDRDNDWTAIALLASLGLATGTAQSLVLHWHVRGSGWWALATAIGWPAGFWAGLALVALAEPYGGPTSLVWIVLGTSLGLCQWLALQNRIRHAWYWAAANPIIWGAGAVLGDRVAYLFHGQSFVVSTPATLIGTLITWIVAESTRGLLLAWLIHRPTSGSLTATHVPTQV
jgi:hypothetical protein